MVFFWFSNCSSLVFFFSGQISSSEVCSPFSLCGWEQCSELGSEYRLLRVTRYFEVLPDLQPQSEVLRLLFWDDSEANSNLLFSEVFWFPCSPQLLVSFVQKHKPGRCSKCPEAGKGPSPGRITEEEGSGQTPERKGQVKQARTEGEREEEDTERRTEAIARNPSGLFSSPFPLASNHLVYGAVYG